MKQLYQQQPRFAFSTTASGEHTATFSSMPEVMQKEVIKCLEMLGIKPDKTA